MKNTLFVVVLALSAGSLFAQEACHNIPQGLQKVLAFNNVQCGRIATINQESSPELEAIYARLREVDNQMDNLRWTEEIPAEEAGRAMWIALIERRKILAEARRLEVEKNQKVLGVLDKKQREVRDQLVALAPAIRLFNEAMSMGLIPFDIVYPIGSGAKGSSADRLRNNQ